MFFLGGGPIKWQDWNTFEETYFLPLGNSLALALNPFVKRRWLKKIDELNPDLVHAHNVIVAHFMLDTEYPVVYDDHEYWSKQTFKFAARSIIRRIATKPLVWKIPHWERKLLERYPVITTNENTAQEHRMTSRHVGVTKNIPYLMEVSGLADRKDRSGIVYVGNDFESPKFLPHRNMAGLTDIIDLSVVNGLTHLEMMEELTRYKIGTTPWLPHPWHPYSEANKNYEYLHAGLQVVVNNVIREPFGDDPYVHGFNGYSDFKQVVDGIEPRPSKEIMVHARKRYIWENQEQEIVDAYTFA